MQGIKLFSVSWEVTTAGPSPHGNHRTEVFFFGCNKATVDNNACKGCFNPALWDSSPTERTHTPEEMADQIDQHAPNRYVTVGGGEPTDQFPQLIELIRLLKAKGFHTMIYTWKDLEAVWRGERGEEEKDYFKQLMQHVDMIVDGEFLIKERVYQGKRKDGMYSSIGSGNQTVWDVKGYRQSGQLKGYAIRELDALHLDPEDNLQYVMKPDSSEDRFKTLEMP